MSKPRVCAVSYLNTVPLVWGMLHGAGPSDGAGIFDLRFALPSACADQIASGEAEIGIAPVIEVARQGLDIFPGTGIACHGAVRSILLISKVPFAQIKTLATDSGSRTSVMLSRVILAEKYGAAPAVISRHADLAAMLGEADAALLIGDAALRVDPAALPFETLDLGTEWNSLTGLPMVFAVWAGRKGVVNDRLTGAFLDSYRYGAARMDAIVAGESVSRAFDAPLVRKYLTEHIVFELTDRDYAGMKLYLEQASKLDRQVVTA